MPVRTRVRGAWAAMKTVFLFAGIRAGAQCNRRPPRCVGGNAPSPREAFPMLRTTLLLGSLLATTLLASPQAHAALVDIDLVDRDTGQWLPETPFRGDTWVAGMPGHRYGVRLTNTSGERVLVVLSVDGVNAVTGQTARPSQAGYVLEPWQSTEIAGWRKSMDDVAQFVFTDLPDSYAARTGRPQNVGVVGIAVYREARPVAYAPPPYIPSPSVPPYERAESRDQAAAKAASPRAQG